MKFIDLTNIEGHTIMVNVEWIDLITNYFDSTKIYFYGDDGGTNVQETPKEVLQKIKEVLGNEI